MKKLTFIFLLFAFSIVDVLAQQLPPIGSYKLDTDEDCIAADGIALKVADYLFATPLITDDDGRIHAARFLNRWMEGTPTYTFMIDEDITRYFDEDPELNDMYMAALTRFTLQHPDIEDEDKISIGALKQVLAYASDDNNKVLMPRKLQKLADAAEKGTLEKVL